MSQVDVAAAAGVDKRQFGRYGAGEQQPVLSVAVAIAIYNLKELRPGSTGRSEIRLLVAGDKAGQWVRWYCENIPIAESQARISQIAHGQVDSLDMLRAYAEALGAQVVDDPRLQMAWAS